MQRKQLKAVLVMLCSTILLTFYTLFILKSNQASQIFSLGNPLYNVELVHYNNLSADYINLFIICLHITTAAIFYFSKDQLIKGLLYLNCGELVLWVLCLGLEIQLSHTHFKAMASLAQFLSLQLSTNILFLFLMLYSKLKENLLIVRRRKYKYRY
ncbi:MAG TPA: hypothetical protein VFC74_10475 [Oscillospiraceae bacterium]|nr:hypothetical protein [Oscillospiraceae bacterium]